MSKAEKTRHFIIEKAAPIFNTKGYAGTSMHDLTLATGLTKGAIYGNFANKDELALAAFEHNFAKIIKTIESLQAPATNAAEKLRAFLTFYRNGLNFKHFSGGCPIINAATEVDDTHPLLKEKVVEAILFWRQNIERIIIKGIEKGEMRKGVSPANFASLMITLIEGGVAIGKITGDMRYLYHALDKLEDMIQTELLA
ncbi:TetR/AcrR family transcriptional regulator [Hugenholtzia roseola]|uniref:TetR/AcrR family transcriptional regulator n=1 Tax=Hugenholtzia roseola TaxID=1002 RepID=UPI00047DE50A|nr:TetR/AcrR family transcriptional regulator [Hugenholtzia roseola]